jgi:phenol 2-monooxygenase
MNVSMADAWNLGWKLAAVLRGAARPELLQTYSAERHAVAKELIDFDREFSALFRGRQAHDPEKFQRYFTAQGRFTAGVATRYAPSMITGEAEFQHLAEGFQIGTRFHSAPVIRLADAKPLQLGHVARADGAWRIYVFADRAGARDLCEFLPSLLGRFTPAGAEPDSVIDVRAVFQTRDVTVDELPAVLLPRKGRFGLVDYEKAFGPDPAADIFELRGVDRAAGCMVVVRPDQYVAHVLPLDAHETLAGFFAASLLSAWRAPGPSP